MRSIFDKKFTIKNLRFFIIIVLLLGLFFRFANLDRKAYWGDEVYTSLWISGYSYEEMNQQLLTGRVVSLEELQKFQHSNPERSVVDTIRNLANDDSQHVPLYYSLLKLWVQFFGDSVVGIRSFSAFVSLLAFPCLYWLCKELFDSLLVGWVAMALIAVSPTHVLYAQEARPYMLWAVMILLSSAALLRTMRIKTQLSWWIYAATVCLGLYTHLLFGLVVIGHGIYVVVIERFRLSKMLITYLLTSLTAFLTFVPWLLIIIFFPSKFGAGNWQTTQSTFLSTVTRLAGTISRVFLDLGFGPDDPFKFLIPLIPLMLMLLTVAAYSIFFIYRQTPKRVGLFVLTLIGVTGLALMLPDLVLGQRRATTRFLFPCLLGIQICVAYLLATQSTSISIPSWRQKVWKFATVMVVSIGVLSCAVSSQAEMWWNKAPELNKHNPQMASIVNQANQPLLLSDHYLIYLQVFGYLLNPKVRFQLMPEPHKLAETHIPEIAKGFSDVFLFNPSKSFRAGLEKMYNSKIKFVYGSLWKLEKGL